jgi:hypothetical protein
LTTGNNPHIKEIRHFLPERLMTEAQTYDNALIFIEKITI